MFDVAYQATPKPAVAPSAVKTARGDNSAFLPAAAQYNPPPSKDPDRPPKSKNLTRAVVGDTVPAVKIPATTPPVAPKEAASNAWSSRYWLSLLRPAIPKPKINAGHSAVELTYEARPGVVELCVPTMPPTRAPAVAELQSAVAYASPLSWWLREVLAWSRHGCTRACCIRERPDRLRPTWTARAEQTHRGKGKARRCPIHWPFDASRAREAPN